ncbi:hypothetical protein NDU88_001467 [Pleurodeles waltl]|uniref:Uncharacterized protein n=1 Tax=Pleurodeles waltl TaxID=8319 RepID=A0AAV7P796_PLEWA|nr:hypothetical protein NDU88_001467 [Pleurodeles waltl]
MPTTRPRETRSPRGDPQHSLTRPYLCPFGRSLATPRSPLPAGPLPVPWAPSFPGLLELAYSPARTIQQQATVLLHFPVQDPAPHHWSNTAAGQRMRVAHPQGPAGP